MAEIAYRYLDVQPVGERACTVRLPNNRLDEGELVQLSEELLNLIATGRPRVALALGPEPPLYMFSVFLARLITAQRTYEINSKVIQASDDMMGTISQIR